MAKGWESKAVEDQQAERSQAVSPPPGVAPAAKARVQADRARQRQALELQREQVLDQRTSSPHRRAALASALSDIEQKLEALDQQE